MSTTSLNAATQNAAGPKPPYSLSWVDRLVDWIAGLPAPAWLVYLSVLLLVGLLNNAVTWLDGTQTAGTFDLKSTANALYAVYGLAFFHYLKGNADRALQKFLPALGGENADEADHRYSLTTLPARWGRVAILTGFTVAIFAVQTTPADSGITPDSSVFARIYYVLNSTLGYSANFALLFLMINQLRRVSRLHRQATEIDLFNLAPAHAFSQLTARAGSILIFIVIFRGFQEPGFVGVYIILALGFGLAACFIFLAPLLGLQSRLKDEKERLLTDVGRRLKFILADIRQRVDSRELSKMSELNTTLTTLLKEQEVVRDISTWPWDPGTLRGFASTLLLPVVLWLINRLLEQMF